LRTAREYLSFQKKDPWTDYWLCKQTTSAAIKVLQQLPRRR
jgi:bifunctional non-homologous end joining protein LigD